MRQDVGGLCYCAPSAPVFVLSVSTLDVYLPFSHRGAGAGSLEESVVVGRRRTDRKQPADPDARCFINADCTFCLVFIFLICVRVVTSKLTC